MRRVCFYHAGCPDGFGAAWAVWRAWGEQGRYLPRGHDEALDAFENGNLSEARALCDRVIALDPLADGVVELSLSIDNNIADKRALEASASGGE